MAGYSKCLVVVFLTMLGPNICYAVDSVNTDKCSHIRLEAGQEYNGYFVGEGSGRRLCCLCPAGTKLEDVCDQTSPNSTRCTPCKHDPSNPDEQYFVSHDGHRLEKCLHDDTFCFPPLIRVDGSRFAKSTCQCPPGFELSDSGRSCRDPLTPVPRTTSFLLPRITSTSTTSTTTASPTTTGQTETTGTKGREEVITERTTTKASINSDPGDLDNGKNNKQDGFNVIVIILIVVFLVVVLVVAFVIWKCTKSRLHSVVYQRGMPNSSGSKMALTGSVSTGPSTPVSGHVTPDYQGDSRMEEVVVQGELESKPNEAVPTERDGHQCSGPGVQDQVVNLREVNLDQHRQPRQMDNAQRFIFVQQLGTKLGGKILRKEVAQIFRAWGLDDSTLDDLDKKYPDTKEMIYQAVRIVHMCMGSRLTPEILIENLQRIETPMQAIIDVILGVERSVMSANPAR